MPIAESQLEAGEEKAKEVELREPWNHCPGRSWQLCPVRAGNCTTVIDCSLGYCLRQRRKEEKYSGFLLTLLSSFSFFLSFFLIAAIEITLFWPYVYCMGVNKVENNEYRCMCQTLHGLTSCLVM